MWLVANLKKQVQHIGQQTPIQKQPMKVVFRVFRAASVTTLAIHMALVNTVTGGVLRSTIILAHGTGACFTMTLTFTGITTARATGLVFVVSKISERSEL